MGKNKGTFLIIFLLFLAIFGIAFTNYHPGTFLTGWDDLHSEFNFPAHFSRVLNAVWQEHQGLGTFIGATYALDFPRLLYLWILSWVLPTSLIRYVFHFSMLFVGTIGTFFVIKSFFIQRGNKNSNVAALFGALFYLGNLGTVQYFATPYEPFSVFWGMFPWLMYSTLRYLQAQTRKNLLIFALINFFATPLAYVPTLFYVYVIVLGILFGGYLNTNRNKKALVTIITTFFFFFCINAFWFVPHIYWVLTESSVQQNAISNILVTSDKYLASQQFGTLSHFALFQNLPWDYTDFSGQTSQFIIQTWHNHLDNGFIATVGYIFFTLALVGIFTIKSYRWFVLGLFVISFLTIANNVPIAREFNLLFRQVSIVNQVLRDPFTKFIVPTLFIFSVGFSGGILFLYKLLPGKSVKPVAFIGSIVLGVSLFFYMLPAYSGHLIADRMKVKTPQYYFDFFNYMNHQDKTKRVADLPQGPIWGWMSYQWGYTGSGFLWHGMSQSILNRTFDVWNDKNEEYYWEMVYALNKRDYNLFHATLRKYNISYVMFDSAIYFPDNPNSVFTILRQKEFIANDPQLQKVKTFGSIDLYETNVKNNNYVSVIDQPTIVTTDTNWLGQDTAYLDYGDYVVDKKGNGVLYPFRSLFSGRGTKDVLYHIVATPSAFIFQQEIPQGELMLPQVSDEELTKFDPKTLHKTKSIPQIINNDHTISIASASSVAKGTLEIVLPRDDRYGSYDSNSQKSIGSEVTCEPGKKGANKQWDQSIQKTSENAQFIRLSATNARTCRVISLQDFSHKFGYLVAVESRNRAGNTLSFWVENLTEKRSDQQIYLKKQSSFGWEYFVVPPMVSDGVGYALHFDNVSIGKQLTENDFAHVIVYPIPYTFLTGMKVVNGPVSETSVDTVAAVSHPSSATYTVSLQNVSDSAVLALYQTYDAGWKAYVTDNWFSQMFPLLFGREITEHVMVNNWANGWRIDPSMFAQDNKQVTITLIFWPQWLEYIGLLLLPVPFIYAFWPRKRKKEEV